METYINKLSLSHCINIDTLIQTQSNIRTSMLISPASACPSSVQKPLIELFSFIFPNTTKHGLAYQLSELNKTLSI